MLMHGYDVLKDNNHNLEEWLKDYIQKYGKIIVTPKLDGIRIIRSKHGHGKVTTRKGKPLTNFTLKRYLQTHMPIGTEGEYVAGKSFTECSASFRRHEEDPPTGWKLYLFDLIDNTETAEQRVLDLINVVYLLNDPHITVVQHMITSDVDEVMRYMEVIEEEKYPYGEGLMIRPAESLYFIGRCTKTNPVLCKIKPYAESDARVLSIIEEVETSGKQKGIAGAVLCVDLATKQEFKCGGFPLDLKKRMWYDKEMYIGAKLQYRYLSTGVKTAPRHPRFLQFTNPELM